MLTWRIASGGYVTATIPRTICRKKPDILLHALLMRRPSGREVDHISGDRMDNRKKNLRLCTHQQNCCNQRKKVNNTSGYTGVSRCKHSDRFEAYVYRNARKIYLGTYATPEAAAYARDQAARRYHGEYARLNFAD